MFKGYMNLNKCIKKVNNRKQIRHFSSLVAQTVKRLPTVWKTLGWEDLLEKEMATHSSIHAWKIPWTDWGRKELDRTE